MAYSAIPDANITNGSPLRDVDLFLLRDNPLAIAAGDTGAPRVLSDTAIDYGGAGVGTTNARDWILTRIASASVGAVGTYALLATATANLNPGSTLAGSSLEYASVIETAPASSAQLVYSSAPSGTWRLMGQIDPAPGTVAVSLWLRIS